MPAYLLLSIFVALSVVYVHGLSIYGLQSVRHAALRPLKATSIELNRMNRLIPTLPIVDSVKALSNPLIYQQFFSLNGRPGEPLAITYLEEELGLSDAVLKRILLKHPWVLYLRVSSNLRPTLDVFYSFDFKRRDVQKVVSRTPSVLAINHEWTLPEKLLSLQKMFYLTRSSLAKLVAAQPYLLTSSIPRNQKTADFLRNTVQLTEKQVAQLLAKDSTVAMTSVDVLRRCWGLLVKLYGFTPEHARSMILRYPALLSSQLVRNAKERLILFSSELGVPSFPSPYIQALALRFPPLLYIDTDTFLRGNVDTLRSLLAGEYCAGCSDGGQRRDGSSSEEAVELVCDTERDGTPQPHAQLTSLLKVFPQLLGYNNHSLRGMCYRALHLLIGQPRHPNEYDAVSADLVPGWEASVTEMSQDGSILGLDLLSEVIEGFTTDDSVPRPAVVDSKSALKIAGRKLLVTKHLALEASHLAIHGARAVQVLRAAPWILSYRTQRSQTVLAALAVSLGLTREELSRCVSIYPRLLSLSVDGKLASVLVRAAQFAAAYRSRGDLSTATRSTDIAAAAASIDSAFNAAAYRSRGDLSTATRSTDIVAAAASIDSAPNAAAYDQSVWGEYRLHPVRRLVRDLVLRYPLLLGTGLERVEERFACAAASGADWDAYLTILRRSPTKHAEWVVKNAVPSPPSLPLWTQVTAPRRTPAAEVASPAAEFLTEEAAVLKVARSTQRMAVKKRKQVKQVASPAERKLAANLRQVLLWRRQVKKSSIVFPEFPEAVHAKTIFSNEKRQMSDSARKALNDLLPYRFLTLG